MRKTITKMRMNLAKLDSLLCLASCLGLGRALDRSCRIQRCQSGAADLVALGAAMTTENVCMKVDALRSTCVTKVGRSSNRSARNRRRHLVHLQRDCGDCRLLVISATLGGSKVHVKVAVDGPGPAMMGEGKWGGTAHDGHVSSRK